MEPTKHMLIHGHEPATPAGLAPSRPPGWIESAPPAELRVEVRTPQALVLDLRANELIVDDCVRPLRALPGCRPFLAALTGGAMVVRTPDGVAIRLEFGWGALACDGAQARISTSRAVIHAVADEEPCRRPTPAPRGRRAARATTARSPRCLMPTPAAA